MSSLLAKLKTNSRISGSATLEDSQIFNLSPSIPTEVPMINVALSGDLEKGLTSGLTVLAGPSKHFKTSFALIMVAAYMKKYPESIVLFYDSEFGSPQAYFKTFGIDTSRVLHCPILNVEDLKFDLMKQLDGIEKNDKVIIMIDSVGNLASKKEVEDAMNEKSVADMSRAKAFKSLFRMVTPHLAMKDIPLVAIGHTYKTQDMYPKDVLSGGCLVAGTEILMLDGKKKNIEDIITGEIVETLAGPKLVTATWNPDTLENGEPECYEITFSDGTKVECSENHKFLIEDQWVEAQNLSVNQKVKRLENCGGLTIAKIKKIGKKKVYDISVADVEHYILAENGVVTHNTGLYYSANTVWILGRQQDKSTDGLQGYHFVINVDKSRFVKEKSKVPISVSFANGVEKYSGLLEVSMTGGFVTKPSQGWYQKKGDTVKYREKDTYTAEFWKDILDSKDFKDYIRDHYTLGGEGQSGLTSIVDDEADES